MWDNEVCSPTGRRRHGGQGVQQQGLTYTHLHFITTWAAGH
jgi:hypothetical protein